MTIFRAPQEWRFYGPPPDGVIIARFALNFSAVHDTTFSIVCSRNSIQFAMPPVNTHGKNSKCSATLIIHFVIDRVQARGILLDPAHEDGAGRSGHVCDVVWHDNRTFMMPL